MPDPPAALIGRAIEGCEGIGEGVADRIVTRVTFEILRPVQIAELRVEAAVVDASTWSRPGDAHGSGPRRAWSGLRGRR